MRDKMMHEEVDELKYRINQLRESLIQIVEETGLNGNETINYSQKLDGPIMKYQKLSSLS